MRTEFVAFSFHAVSKFRLCREETSQVSMVFVVFQ